MKLCLIMGLETHDSDMAQILSGEIMEPLGLAYIAGKVRTHGHDVIIIDRRIIFQRCNYDLNELDNITLSLINNFKADYVGFYLNIVFMNDVSYFSEKIKKIMPHIKIIIGGPQITLVEETINYLHFADIYSYGEGEITTTEILDGLPLEKISGIRYRNSDGEIVRNLPRPLISNLDDLPYPARDLLDMKFYIKPDKNILVDYTKNFPEDHPMMAEIITSRGCVMKCDFCACPILWKNCIRFHSPGRIVEEFKEVIKFGANYVYLNDDLFTINKKRAIETCKLLEKEALNIKWVAQSRPEHVDVEVLEAMKRAGCVRIEFGFESGSQDMLNKMNKCTKVEQYLHLVNIVKKVGLAFQANIIFGYPGETEENIQETIDFLKKIQPDSVLLNAFQPIPGTQSYSRLIEKGIRLNNEYIPTHPYLMPYNFTLLSDDKYNIYFRKLIEYAPEALEFYKKNKDLFDRVAKKRHTVFSPIEI